MNVGDGGMIRGVKRPFPYAESASAARNVSQRVENRWGNYDVEALIAAYPCPGCGGPVEHKISHSARNPERGFLKCNRCDNFKWADEAARDKGVGAGPAVSDAEIAEWRADSDAVIAEAKATGKIPPPLCMCEPYGYACAEFVVNKEGPNKGKKYYACPRDVKCKMFIFEEEHMSKQTRFPPTASVTLPHTNVESGSDLNYTAADFVRGTAVLDAFAAEARRRGFTVIPASPITQRTEHYHVTLTLGPYDEVEARVCVVAARVASAEDPPDVDHAALLWHGYADEDLGFVRAPTKENERGGRADILAVETRRGFALFNRKKVWAAVDGRPTVGTMGRREEWIRVPLGDLQDCLIEDGAWVIDG